MTEYDNLLYEFDVKKYKSDTLAWEAFKEITKTRTKKIHNYYKVLFILRRQLVADAMIRTNKEVALDINMKQTKFSHIHQILRAELGA